MTTVLSIVLILLAVLLIGSILMQTGRNGGLTGGGGIVDNPYSKRRGKEEILTRTSAVLGALFLTGALVMSLFH